MGLHERIGADLDKLGGVLRCERCRSWRPMDKAGHYLRSGWPECCGYTMTWVTARQLAAEGKVRR